MADKKFSELSAASTLAGTEIVAITQSSSSVRTTATAIGNTASTVQLSNTGLTVLDTDASHALTIKPGSNLTAARILTVTTGDAARTLTLTGDVTLPATLPTSTTDNTLPRFDSTAGSMQTSGITVDDSDNVTGVVALTTTGAVASSSSVKSTGATAGVGYATGAGGTVTQITTRTTGVTLNKACGAITLVSAAGSATPATFTVTNSAVAATDVIILNQKSGTDLYELHVTAVAAGSFNITFFTTGGTTTETPVINFAVIKGVAA